MEKERSHMMEILDLSLEIIYLLTGEDYIVVKRTSGDHLTLSSCCHGFKGFSRSQSPIIVPPAFSRSNNKKILEVIQKLIELLTGEEKYSEGHKDLYKDVMMASQPALTSPDGSSNGNPPERYPRPLYSRDSTQEHQEIPDQDQNKMHTDFEVETTNENPYGTCNESCKEETVPPEISTVGWETNKSLDLFLRCKTEDMSSSSAETGITPNLHPEACVGSSPACNVEDKNIAFGSSEDKSPNNKNFHPEAPSAHLSLDPPTCSRYPPENTETFSSLEAKPPDPNRHAGPSSAHLSTDPSSYGRDPVDHTETFSSSENRPNPNHYPGHSSDHPSSDPSTCGMLPLENREMVADPGAVDALFVCSVCAKWFLLKLPPQEYQTINSHKIPFLCPDCGKRVTQDKGPSRNRKADKETYECSECGKHFGFNSELVRHCLTHTGEKPYQCVECGKRFRQRGSLREHQKMHFGDKPFSCSECGSCFTRKIFLQNHQRTHTGEKPFSCLECGRCFAQEAVLIRHQVVHTGVKPFTCMDCGKSFAHRSSFMTHRRIHTGFEPYPCSECGKRFKQKSYLVDHFRLHTGEKPYGCAECGERFTRRLFLRKHEQVHTGTTWFPCLDCGKKFTEKRLLNRHQRIHSADKLLSSPPESQLGSSQKSKLTEHWRTHDIQKPSSNRERGDPCTVE